MLGVAGLILCIINSMLPKSHPQEAAEQLRSKLAKSLSQSFLDGSLELALSGLAIAGTSSFVVLLLLLSLLLCFCVLVSWLFVAHTQWR